MMPSAGVAPSMQMFWFIVAVLLLFSPILHHADAITAQREKKPCNNSSLFVLSQILWDVANETYEMVPFIGPGIN